MKITPELIDKIMEKRPLGINITNWICSELNRIESIESAVADVYQAQRRIEEQAKKAQQKEAERLHEIQVTCPHYVTPLHPDAAGGSDSFTRCDICDKEL